jgi:hypothetical protein
MEKVKLTIEQVMTTGTTQCTGCTGMCTYYTTGGTYYTKYGCTTHNIVPDLSVVYNVKICLESIALNLGFFNIIDEIETNVDDEEDVGDDDTSTETGGETSGA